MLVNRTWMVPTGCHWQCQDVASCICVAWSVSWCSLPWWLFLRCPRRIPLKMDPCQARCLDRIDSPTLDGTSLPVMACIGWSRQTHRWECCCWLPTCDSSWYIHPDGWDSCWWGSCCAWSSMPWLNDSCWLLCCNFARCALWALWSD